MSVKKEASGRRYVEVETEVPGTPEEVWAAIASGPGISSWFVPTEVDERVGGKVVCHFGPGMEGAATIREWEAPRRFFAEGDDMGDGSPVLGSEWTVEARQGGVCVVRVVNSFFAEGDDWDGQLIGFESGWPGFFKVLDLYLRHFRGLPVSSFLLMNLGSGDTAGLWARLTAALGMEGAAVGDRLRSPAGVPPYAGRVEVAGTGLVPHCLILRLEEPCGGIASFGAHEMGGQACAALTVYLYGASAAQQAEILKQEWSAWLAAFRPPA